MKGFPTIIVFVLLLIGTIGLLINDFVFDWGRMMTLVFAVINLIGVVLFIVLPVKTRS